ncbi:MAG: hypothetical protein IT303_10630 [Dehalococcoidia bacterium]|nr:hypothetical protein [Dehalococcoidia bacterium]
MDNDALAGARAAEMEQLRERRAWAAALGGPARVARQHERGRLTARERCLALVDPGSFFETGMLAHSEEPQYAGRTPGDGIITGYGRINGRMVAVQANDATVLGGSEGMEAAARKMARLHGFAAENGFPFIELSEGGGGRIGNLMGWQIARVGGFRRHSGTGGTTDPRYRIPRVTAVLGHAYGGSAFSVGTSDFAVMSRGSTFSVSSPALIQVATGEVVSDEELGGVDVHTRITGLADGVGETEEETLQLVRRFIDLVPLSVNKGLPILPCDDPVTRRDESLRSIVPERAVRAFDIKRVVRSVLDTGSFLELKAEYGRSIVAGLGRVGGIPVGILANDSRYRAGAIDADAAKKMTKLMRLCNTFGLPMVFFHDVPGVLIGKQMEHEGIIEQIMGVMSELRNATVPRVAIIVRKSYGLAMLAMSASYDINCFTFAWPSARMGFMAPDAGVRIAYGHELGELGSDPAALQARYEELIRKWEEEGAPWEAAGWNYIEDVIDPAETREVVFRALEVGLGRDA